jgi:Flp pilus assembly protein TadG
MKRGNLKLKMRKQQNGIAIIEFAIAAPVVLFLMLAVAEFGNALFTYNTLTKSLRDGARQLASTATVGSTGVVNPSATDISEAINLIAYGRRTPGEPVLPDLSPANVSWNLVTTTGGQQLIAMRVDYPYQPLLIGGVPRVFRAGSETNTFTLSAEMVVRPLR